MLIIRTRHRSPSTRRSHPVVAIFWSHGLLCQLIRACDERQVWSWSLWVRLWDAHPWLVRERQLQRAVDGWSRRALEIKPLSSPRHATSVEGRWVLVEMENPQVRLNADYIREPERYWYKEETPTRDRKHYKLAATYMESLSGYLCSTLNEIP